MASTSDNGKQDQKPEQKSVDNTGALAAAAVDYGGFTFYEAVNSHLYLHMKLKRVMVSDRSAFQEMQIIETEAFGKTLVLDRHTQSAQLDEHIYHESLVHPALLAHPNPKTVFIGGGGEMASAREVLRHKSVEKVIMVDIDQRVVEFCMKEMPEWNDGAFDDPRLTVRYEDAHAYLKNYKGTFDVIYMDINDPVEAGPGIILYTQEFNKMLVEKLNPDGIFVTQAGPCGRLTYEECFTVVNKTLRTVFKHVHGYSIEIPSFGCPWGFNLATNADYLANFPTRDASITDSLIAERLNQLDKKPLESYDGVSHLHMFNLPKWARQGCGKETRVMTIDNPVFLHQ